MESNQPQLSRILRLTTTTGIFQHSKEEPPNPVHGYALEDQARALIAVNGFDRKDFEKIYLDFIIRAKRKDGLLYQYYYENIGFKNNSFKKTTIASNEALGIVVWSLYKTNSQNYSPEISTILNNLEKSASLWTSPRAIASALIGLSTLDNQKELEKTLLKTLKEHFADCSKPDWIWFENYFCYANAILPWALWEVALSRKDEQAKEIAEKSTKFLLETCQVDGIPCPIGNNGWYVKGKEKAIYDQQPIDPAYMVCCLEKAFETTKDNYYLDWAKKWWSWFLGNNINKVSMVTDDSSCYDGLTKEGPNKNSGAESSICFIMAYLAAKRLNIHKDIL